MILFFSEMQNTADSSGLQAYWNCKNSKNLPTQPKCASILLDSKKFESVESSKANREPTSLPSI